MSAAATSETKVITPAAPKVSLAGKVALITGASRGIGAGIALALARDGIKGVVVNYHKDKKSADAVVAAINNVAGTTAIAIQADVAKSADVDRLFTEAKAHYGRIDIVVANSGTNGALATLGATTNEYYDLLVGTNQNGTFYTLRAASNHIEDKGRIVIIGSLAKVGLVAGLGVYAATKAAIEVFSNTLAQELGPRGITVNTLHPGPIETELMLSSPPALVEYSKNLSPQKRIGSVAEIADAVAFFVSDGAKWISGQNVMVTGAAKSA